MTAKTTKKPVAKKAASKASKAKAVEGNPDHCPVCNGSGRTADYAGSCPACDGTGFKQPNTEG